MLSGWGATELSGLALVFFGVAGEVISERLRDETGHELRRRIAIKRWSERILIVGLAIDIWVCPHHIKEASNANVRAAVTESNNAILSSKVLELAHQYDLSTNALAEANARVSAIGGAVSSMGTTAIRRARKFFDQTDRFISIVKSGPISTAQIVFSPGSGESFEFANTLAGFLRTAGWKVIAPKPIPMDGKYELGTLTMYGTAQPLASQLGAQSHLGGVAFKFGPGTLGNADPVPVLFSGKQPDSAGQAILAAFSSLNFSFVFGTENNIKQNSMIIVIGQIW